MVPLRRGLGRGRRRALQAMGRALGRHHSIIRTVCAVLVNGALGETDRSSAQALQY
jgi:hypothetical protein